VDKKLQSINQQAFKEGKRRSADKYSMDEDERASGALPPAIKNYFELLKTDSHQKQTKYISQALNCFLGSIQMIVF